MSWKRAHPAAIGISVAYVIVSAVWIFLSDQFLVDFLLAAPFETATAQSIKGLAFVLVTGLLLFFGLNRVLRVRDEAQQELSQSLHTLSAVFESSPLAIVAVDLEGKIVTWNLAAEQIFGWSKGEANGHDFTLLVPPEDVDSTAQRMERLQKGEPVTGLEIERLTKEGGRVPVQLWTRTVRDSHGKTIGTVGTFADLREKKDLELQLQQAQKMEVIGRLAGGVAHDFNNILTAIGGFADLAADEVEPDSRVCEDLKEISNLVDRATALTRQLLVFSHKHKPEPVDTDLTRLFRSWLKVLGQVTGSSVRLQFNPATADTPVRVDAEQIEQVLMNLVINARDATAEEGVISVETEAIEINEANRVRHYNIPHGQYVTFVVKDTGCGISPEAIDKIFEPFYTTKGKEKGTGLGLSVAYGIIKEHGGFIHVWSEIGKGTTFRVYLPRRMEPARLSVEIETEKLLPKGSETILVVDDEEPIRILVKEVLAGLGYTVLSAADFRGAREILLRHSEAIRLVVTDTTLSRGELERLTAEISKNVGSPAVLRMSGAIDNALVKKTGAANFLPKPFPPSVLARKVREALDSEFGPPQPGGGLAQP